jgi:hypothetical protein
VVEWRRDEEETFPVLDLAFYNTGCHDPRGLRWPLVLVRRLLRRLLRPFFLRQVELLQHIIDRLDRDEPILRTVRDDVDRLDQRVETVLAFSWDYVAMVRRLAAIEDQLAVLTGHTPAVPEETDSQPSIRFPSLDPVPEPRSKVCSHGS